MKTFAFVAAIALAALAALALGQTSLQPIIVNVIGGSETDGGFNVFTQGSVSGFFYTANWSANGTYTDTCTSSTVLGEGVWGGSYGSNYSSLAALIYFDCTGLGSGYACSSGACVQNQTNVSLPDLIVTSLNAYVNYPNISNQTNTTVSLVAIVRNIGNAPAGPSLTQLKTFHLNGVPQYAQNIPTLALPPGQQTVVFASFSNIAPPGTWIATATADQPPQIAESNENNNAFQITYTV